MFWKQLRRPVSTLFLLCRPNKDTHFPHKTSFICVDFSQACFLRHPKSLCPFLASQGTPPRDMPPLGFFTGDLFPLLSF